MKLVVAGIVGLTVIVGMVVGVFYLMYKAFDDNNWEEG